MVAVAMGVEATVMAMVKEVAKVTARARVTAMVGEPAGLEEMTGWAVAAATAVALAAVDSGSWVEEVDLSIRCSLGGVWHSPDTRSDSLGFHTTTLHTTRHICISGTLEDALRCNTNLSRRTANRGTRKGTATWLLPPLQVRSRSRARGIEESRPPRAWLSSGKHL